MCVQYVKLKKFAILQNCNKLAVVVFINNVSNLSNLPYNFFPYQL